jgi:hypothetical protein
VNCALKLLGRALGVLIDFGLGKDPLPWDYRSPTTRNGR